MMEHLAQILLLLGVAVAVVLAFQRLHIPTSLGYLLVGVILGPHTTGPTVNVPEFKVLAEFGVVFLLFTIGLNYSLPQLHALRHQVLGLGTAQVVFTTAVVGVLLWLAGVPAAGAFVIGAVFAQSSSTIIGSQLAEQGEENSPHGRLGLAMSVFQDVTAVPFLVVIPVLGVAAGADVLAGSLGWAIAKAVLAFALVFFAGRWLLRPLFHLVTQRRSAEVFTLAVLLVTLLAAWTTNSLGLSLAFGAFLAGMMLGETEFRHQVESSVRPFRDVLLGLFFIGIGMLIDPAILPQIWHWALLGGLLILLSKILLVAAMVHKSGIASLMAWRTGLLLAVGGEFGFALLAIALDAKVIDVHLGQIALTSVLFSMIAGAFLIRFNLAIATRLTGARRVEADTIPEKILDVQEQRVLIGGYGRVGHTIAVLLQSSGVPFIAFDSDVQRVAKGRADGHQVLYGDISDPELLAAVHVERAALVVITVDNPATALRAVTYMRSNCPHVPVIARARDLESSSRLLDAGATHAYPEALEASMRLGATALQMLQIPTGDIDVLIQGVRDWGYKPIVEAEQNEKNKIS
ncbi:MAG: sodium:proton exchanger [Gallionellales bacterium 35-53-114]|jgi:CPA2 family monovalent cation:H+ antiporter-2|nr:MAG: sodium:proton exchanger [Gallionellales bacterium 35-53-114]OYZ63240.1 MAG: sodium:proton exchanger [Gallionellales bacterium 24-53-125]OZB08705.1 MAG: sodium:proton exchanger [Gallionellales bacterium 39-52-133]HQS57433.1 cation:proton antiporter [Gallionellaceae bacterium]HQS74379.1 cation:proton antiporter [Gallionellaceae bacterium]